MRGLSDSVPVQARTIDASERSERRALVTQLAWSVALSLGFALVVAPYLEVLTWDYDEGWYALGGRFITEGQRPLADFAYIQPPLHLYLLALFAKLFGSSVAGFRMLSLVSLCSSGILLFLLIRPVMGSLAALFAQALFLFSTTQVHALGAIPDTPMVTFCLLGALLLFHGSTPASAWAAGAAFVAALFIKPTCLLMIMAAAISLLLAGQIRRVLHLAAAGVLASAIGLLWLIVSSDGVFVEVLQWQLFDRFLTRQATNWTMPSLFTDSRHDVGIDSSWQLAVRTVQEFLEYPSRKLPLAIAVASLAGVPFWIASMRRHRALSWFALLAPLSFLVVNFAAMDFVSAKYFVPFPPLVALLAAGLIWGLARRIPRPFAVASVLAATLALAGAVLHAMPGYSDPWYRDRVAYLAEQPGALVGFSPMFFVAARREPGCGLWNPAIAYGDFGVQILTAERMHRFRNTDAELIDCFRSNPDARMLVDFWYYFFTRGTGDLDRFLHEEGSERLVFFSPAVSRRWNDPHAEIGSVQR